MANTSLSDFTPASIDMIFAVSQQNLNEGLAEYISGLNAQVSWGFDVNDAGDLTPPANPAKPNITFSGTLAPPIQPAQGAPVWIVDLSQAGAANQVTFNLTFQDGATFTDNQTGRTYTQSAGSGGALWVIPYQVDLTLAAITDQTNLPEWLKQQLAILNNNYGEVFDLSQVLLDLETLASTVDPKSVLPAGISLYEWTLILQGMTQYIQANSGVIFTQPPSTGYAVTHNGATPTQPLPTYTPTAADFVIIPDTANYGAASTLVFVLMVQGAPLPNAPANAFTDVTLISDPATTPGIALIGAPRFLSFVQTDFSNAGIGGAISQYVQSIKSDQDGVSWQLAASSATATATTATPTTQNGQTFLTFAMPTQNSNADNFVMTSTYTASSTTNSTAAATFGDPETGIGYGAIVVNGTLSMQVGYSYTPPSHGGIAPIPTAWESPTFDWNWSAWYDIQSVNAKDAQSGGGVQFVLDIAHSTFPTTPVDAGGGDASWFSVEPSDQDFIQNLLAPVITALPTAFQTSLTSLASLGNFVFPGGGTFTFQNPAVNNAGALYTTIQYQNPN